MEIESKTAVVTGSSRCVGAAVAVALAREGCRCVCHYHHNRAGAMEVVEKIAAEGGQAIAVRADLTCHEEIVRLFEVCREFGLPEILVNSAAIFERSSISEINFENARRMLDTNLVAPILVSGAFAEAAKGIKASGNLPVAKIVNLVDIGGIRPWADYTLYCASKAGLIAAGKSLAKELAPKICVNAVAPGIVSWPDGGDMDQYNRQVSMIPAGRTGTPEDIASAVIFLVKNDYITGQVINVDGGRCI